MDNVAILTNGSLSIQAKQNWRMISVKCVASNSVGLIEKEVTVSVIGNNLNYNEPNLSASFYLYFIPMIF